MSTLSRLFNQDRLKTKDPNKPENVPLLKAEASLKNQAFVQWYEGPGRYLVDGLESALISKIVKAIGYPRESIDQILLNIRLLDEIKRDIEFVDHIVNAFEEEKIRKERNSAKPDVR